MGPTSTPAARLVVAAGGTKGGKGDQLRKARGYVTQDNSGKSNVFGTVPDKLYTYSPTNARVASSGLGGMQGVAVLGAVVLLVAIATSGVVKVENDQGTLNQARAEVQQLQSLSSIATRLSASL